LLSLWIVLGLLLVYLSAGGAASSRPTWICEVGPVLGLGLSIKLSAVLSLAAILI
jgi:hypothetical protein